MTNHPLSLLKSRQAINRINRCQNFSGSLPEISVFSVSIACRVNGTRHVLQVCEKLNIPHIIVASSGTAYGAWPDNPPALKEDDPIRLFPPNFNYAHHKGLVEQDFVKYIQVHPETIFNIVCNCVVYGPHTDNYLSRYLKKMPMIFLADGLDPDLEIVHEADVVTPFSLLIEKSSRCV